MTLRILLADDHPLVSAAVADRLYTQTGWEVCGSVTSATALLNSVESLRPDVVITDYHMPAQGEGNSDGLRLLASLRRRHPSLAVIVLTSPIRWCCAPSSTPRCTACCSRTRRCQNW
jgi:two-component system capsular synthesis response regulator RcsB